MKKEYAEEVAAKIIEQLEQGTAPWQKPWKPGELSLPYNAATGKEYRGINSMWLAMQGHGDPRWMTYNQAGEAGAQVRKGAKGTKIVYWKTHDEERAKDEGGKPIIGDDGKPKMIRVALERPRAFHAVVFNAEQIDGLPPLEPKIIAPEPERHARAEAILASSGANIQHVAGNRAFYRPSTDSITLPERRQFQSADGYYATALHELGHWTGHPSRLDRDLAHPFGSEGYAREELRAEISSLMVGERLELGHDPGQHAAYVGSWVKSLKEDPREIFRAAADAEKIAAYVMAFEQEQVREQTQEQDAGHPAMPAAAENAIANARRAILAGFDASESWSEKETAARARAEARSALSALDDGDVMYAANRVHAAALMEQRGGSNGADDFLKASELTAELAGLTAGAADQSMSEERNTQAELSSAQQTVLDLLRQSTLTPSEYEPTPGMMGTAHVAIVVGDKPVILIGPADDVESQRIANRLADSDSMSGLLFAVFPELGANIRVADVPGSDVSWASSMSSLAAKASGQVEEGGEPGPLVAVFLDRQRGNAVAVGMAINDEILHCIDPDAPRLEAGGMAFEKEKTQEKPQEQAVEQVQTVVDAFATPEPSPYNERRIRWELERTAAGDAYYGNALRVALDMPGVDADDRAMLNRWATGTQNSTDHISLQDLAMKIAPEADLVLPGVTVVQEMQSKETALNLPAGWTETTPGGMATNLDPVHGGIVDANIVSGQWFFVPNRDGIDASEAVYPTRTAALEGLAETLAKVPEPEQHYSDQTLQALIEEHGWEATQGSGNGIVSVKRQFEGIGPTGTMVTPNGERNLYAGYNADPERRRYIALTLGDATIMDFDGRDARPADIARLVNLSAEQYADQKRVARGLEPKYALDAPTLDLPAGNPQAVRDAGAAVEQYDMQRRQEAQAVGLPAAADDQEAKLRAIWSEQGVPQQQQDAMITQITALAQPGAQIGPFTLPSGDTAGINYAGLFTAAAERHIEHSVMAAKYEGHTHTVIEADAIIARFAERLTPEQFAAFDYQKAEKTVFDRLAEVEKELGLPGAESATASGVLHHPPENPVPERTYLAVPYAEKEQAKNVAKESGFKLQWDKENKAWFAPAGADLSRMDQWKPDAPRVQTPTAKSAEEQFSDALKEAGLVVDGLPIMNGKIQRVAVEGDRGSETSGAYAGHMEGRIPGGYIQNFKTGEIVNWKAEGTIAQTTPEERARLAAEAAERQQKREAETGQKQEATAAAANALWEHCPPATAENAYCKAKGITDPVGLRTVPEAIPEDVAKAHNIHIAKTVREAKALREADPEARVFKTGDLLIPARDNEQKLWTLQSVNPTFKSFMKGGRKHGLFAQAGIGKPDTLEKLGDPKVPVIVAEGYATADAVSKLAGQPVIVAFDSGNLDAIVRDRREWQPERTILIAADNDHEAPSKLGTDGKPRQNVGMEKATAAAQEHGAGVVAPQFRTGEKGSDWNDYLATRGEDDARRDFAEQMALAKRDAAINAERLTTLARERDQDARNDPTTSLDDAAVAAERGKAASMITSAGEQVSHINNAADQGLANNSGGTPALSSVKASLDRKTGELKDDTKQERAEVLGDKDSKEVPWKKLPKEIRDIKTAAALEGRAVTLPADAPAKLRKAAGLEVVKRRQSAGAEL